MKFFEYLETEWTKSSERLAVRPADITIPNQARFNAAQSLINGGRSVVKWAYVFLFLARYGLMKTGIKAFPSFKSSIPQQTKGPQLVNPEPPSAA